MALINCPECSKEVSDRAATCIHCGYPLQSQHAVQSIASKSKKIVLIGKYNRSISLESKFMNILPMIHIADGGKYLYTDGEKVLIDGLSSCYSSVLKGKLEQIGLKVRIDGSTSEIKFENPKNPSGKICCPKCGSLEYNAGAKGFSVVTGFIGSGKTVITCLRCGNRWKPGK